MNTIEQLQQDFVQTLQNLFTLSKEQVSPVTVEINTDSASKKGFGDLSSNAALVLARVVNRNPKIIAQTIKEHFRHPAVEELSIAGPGFINMTLKLEFFDKLATQLLEQQTNFFKPDTVQHRLYNIEFVSANPTGPLHIGHGRGGIIGDVLGNILRFVGNNVCKEFYINDAGAQMQKLGTSFKIRCMQGLGCEASLAEEGYHGTYLIDLATEAIEHYGRTLLDKPDSFFVSYAQDRMLTYIQHTLSLYGIEYDEWFSEKSLHTSGAIDRTVKLLGQRGYTYEEEDALWFKSTLFGDDKDRVLRRANGELTYAAADAAYIRNKIERGFDQLVMVLGQDHHSYVVRLKAIMQALGYDPEQLNVILYQLVTLKESGESLRLSKRAGRMITLRDVIDVVGADVARFFYLNKKADAHLDFDIDLALKKSDENPVYYLQYAYVRIKSILHKAEEYDALQNITKADAQQMKRSEAELLKKVISLKQLLMTIGNNCQTHLLTYYALELATAFHHYYSKHRVVVPEDVPTSRSRLALMSILQQTISLCTALMGISLPEKM